MLPWVQKNAARTQARAVALTLSLILLIGCEADDRESPDKRADQPAHADRAPLVPGAPDFALPADWAEQHPTLSPNAKPEAHYLGLAEASIARNPADGDGRAWLVSSHAIESRTNPTPPATPLSRPRFEASSFHRFEIRFEVGPHGIEEGGVLFLAPEAFWFWSDAQTADPRAPGYTTARPAEGSDDVTLRATPDGAAFVVEGRRLEAGESIDFVYGAGPAGAQVDRYADRGAEIMLAVDADGDGFREWLDEGVRVDVVARPGAHLVAYGPAEIRPGEPFEIQAAIIDRVGNRARWPEATRDPDGRSRGVFEIRVLENATLGLAEDNSRAVATTGFEEPKRFALDPAPGRGTLRLRLEGREALEGLAVDLPPIVVRAGRAVAGGEPDERLVWGDLHGHTRASDGTGTAQDYFAYARDVARLDVVALTDHDHWGARALDEHPDTASAIFETSEAYHAPGRFVTIPGYEWTSWLHGHRHVLYFEANTHEDAPILSALAPETDRPDELWAALRGRAALTFAHHSAGEPVATNWHFPPDPILEPLTEIASVHGTSEAADAPLVIRGAVPGNFARDVLVHGARLGFVGSGDSHDGHPGLAQIASGQAGLAGLFTSALDRESLLRSMRRRRTFATNGIRPWFAVHLDETPMGGVLPDNEKDEEDEGSARGEAGERDEGNNAAADPDGRGARAWPTLRIEYEGTAPIARVDLVRGGRVASLEVDGGIEGQDEEVGGLSYRLTRKIPPLVPGEFHYVRIQQQDGGVAWSSPIFAEARGRAGQLDRADDGADDGAKGEPVAPTR